MKTRRYWLCLLIFFISCNFPINLSGLITPAPQHDPQFVSATPAESKPENLIRFETLTEGATIFGTVDPLTGLPSASVTVVFDDPSNFIYLDADGIVSAFQYPASLTTDTTTLQWTPWHGNGKYQLDLYLVRPTSAAGEIISLQTINIIVEGIPSGTPTVQERFSQLFQERFGFYAPQPAFTRYIKLFPEAFDPSQWTSVIYYGEYQYEIRILEDGSVENYYTYTNFDSQYSICKPAGIIRMLAVIVDYGNTGIQPADAENGLYEGLAIANQRWADYSTKIGLTQPILQVELTTAIAGAPAIPGQYLTVDEIRARTGYEPTQFNILAEIDLDKDNLTTGQYGGLGVSLTGGCRPSGPEKVNIAYTVSEATTPEALNGASIFEHELTHAMGWQHWWANGSGNTPDWTTLAGNWMPYKMFGWVDIDGDGIIEIQDPTPYGIQ